MYNKWELHKNTSVIFPGKRKYLFNYVPVSLKIFFAFGNGSHKKDLYKEIYVYMKIIIAYWQYAKTKE